MPTQKWKDENHASILEYRRNWYARNKKTEVSRVSLRKKQIRDWFDAYKQSLVCSRCPETDSVCLDFHHTDPSTKSFNVAVGVNCGYSKKRILAEVAKCEVVCSNCHRKHHALVV